MIHHIVLRKNKVAAPQRWKIDEHWQEPMELWMRPQDLGALMPTIKVLFDTLSIKRILRAKQS